MPSFGDWFVGTGDLALVPTKPSRPKRNRAKTKAQKKARKKNRRR